MSTRVLLLTRGLNPGGTERLLLGMLRHADHGRFSYEVAYLTAGADALRPAFAAIDVPVHRVGLAGLRRLVRNGRFDVVHAHAPVPAIVARVALRGVPVVYTEHSVWSGYGVATRWLNAATFRLNAHAFAVADEVGRSVRRPVVRDRVETLYQGLDLTRIPDRIDRREVRREMGVAPDTPLVGSVANFTPQKSHDTMLGALALLRARVEGVRAVLVGSGPNESAVRSLARAMDLEDTVAFTGHRPDAVRVAAAMDVFLLSSSHEGLSIAMLEAMAVGTPVVVTRVGGLPEVVRDGVDGVLVAPGDANGLASAAASLLANPDRRERMGESARERARSFDLRTAVARTESVYAGVVA